MKNPYQPPPCLRGIDAEGLDRTRAVHDAVEPVFVAVPTPHRNLRFPKTRAIAVPEERFSDNIMAVPFGTVVSVHLSITHTEKKRDLKPKSNLENLWIQTTNQNLDQIRSKDSKPTTNTNIKTQTS